MKHNHSPEVLAAAVSLLRIADPELTATGLLEALESRATSQPVKPLTKMLTLQEFAKLAGLSMPTVHRMKSRGELPTVRLGERNQRVPADVAEKILNGTFIPAVKA